MQMGHEDLNRTDAVKVGSERSFGIVFACVFALFGAKAFMSGGKYTWLWLGGAVSFLTIAFVLPRLLRPFNIAWFRFGLLLNKIVNPIVLGIMFYAIITPIGLLMRAFDKRPLNLDKKPLETSYWSKKDLPGSAPSNFRDQF
jgi:hypothetical protein